MIGIPNQHQRGTQTTRGAIASGFKSALACVVGVPTSYDLQHDTRLRAGGFFLVKLAGRHCPVPFQRNSHRREFSSLSRRYWHGVELCSLGSAVPFLIRGAFNRSHFHGVDYVPAKFANRPHHNRAFPFPPSSDGSKTIGKDLTRGSQSLSPDDKTYD